MLFLTMSTSRLSKRTIPLIGLILLMWAVNFTCFSVTWSAPTEKPAPAAADAKVEDTLAAFYKDKTRPNAEAVFEAIKRSIEEKRTGGDYQAAIKLAIKGASVAKLIKGKEYDEFQSLKKQIIEERDLATLKAKLQKSLAANPKNKLVRERLIRIALLNEDKPDQAAKYADENAPESLRNIVSLAGKTPSELEEEQLLVLSEWYCQNGKKFPAAKKRTIAYLEAFLDKHKQQDAQYHQARKLLSNLNAKGGKLGKNTFHIPAGSDWVATMKIKERQKYLIRTQGVWYGGPSNNMDNKADGDGGKSRNSRTTYYLEGKIPVPTKIDPSLYLTKRLGGTGLFTCLRDDVLYLRMHDEGNRRDNRGELIVTITETDIDRIEDLEK